MTETPENTRWSLNNTSRCGMRTFLRPCQTGDQKSIPDSGFPLHPICRPEGETVYIVDDDKDFLDEMVESIRVFGYNARGFQSGDELRVIAGEDPCGCILLDIKLPGQDGISIHEWIRQSNLALSVVYISATHDVDTVAHCMKIGAIEFVHKPFGEMALRNAVRMGIAEARKLRCRYESTQLVKSMIDTLTPTELHVARMIARGHPTKSVASDMSRSENTVKIHRHRIFSKLKVNSTASVANILGQLDGQLPRSEAQKKEFHAS